MDFKSSNREAFGENGYDALYNCKCIMKPLHTGRTDAVPVAD